VFAYNFKQYSIQVRE